MLNRNRSQKSEQDRIVCFIGDERGTANIAAWGQCPHAGGNADRIRPVGVVLLRHGIKHRGMFARAPWSMPMNRVIQQEAYPL